jgi:hypothetical protein
MAKCHDMESFEWQSGMESFEWQGVMTWSRDGEMSCYGVTLNVKCHDVESFKLQCVLTCQSAITGSFEWRSVTSRSHFGWQCVVKRFHRNATSARSNR